MAACSHAMHTLRLPLRLESWRWASTSIPKTIYRKMAMNAPYSETSTMVALRRLPISTAPLDSSIFEVEEEEYSHVKLKLPALNSADAQLANSGVRTPSLVLAQLVREQMFVDAAKVKSEMVEMGLRIEQNDVYEHAALHALKSGVDRETRLSSVMGWFSLIPPRQGPSLPRFDSFLHYLLREDHPDIPLIMRITTVCISKGHTITVPHRTLAFVVRFAEPSVSLNFLEEIHAAAQGHENTGSRQRLLKRWFSQAIKGYAVANRSEYALKALQLATSHGIELTRFTLALLAQRMGSAKNCPAEVLEFMQSPQQVEPSSDISLVKLSSAPLSVHPSDLITEQVDPFQFTSSDDDTLADTLWRLRKAVGTYNQPSAVTIAQFIEAYVSTQDRLTGILLLRRKAQRAGTRFRSHWAMAEMLYYGKRGQWAQLLGTFDDYFYTSGVPQELHVYKKRPFMVGRGRSKQHLRNQRALQSNATKLFPTIFHTSLVWRALVEMLDGTAMLPVIYDRLLSEARATTSTHSSLGKEAAQASIKPPPSQASDAAHFTPFLYSLFRGKRSRRIQTMFSDMTRLGIQPTLPQIALFAGSHAIRGAYDEAVQVLDMLEKALAMDRLGRATDPLSEAELQRYLVAYLPSFSGFLDRKHLRGACLVRDRLLEHGYIPGSNELVERNMGKLEEVQMWWKNQSASTTVQK